MSDTKASRTVVTPECIGSFLNFFEPAEDFNGDPKFGGTFVFTPEQQKTKEFGALKDAIVAVAKEAFGAKAGEVLRNQEHKPIRTDPEKNAKYGYPEGSVFIVAKSTTRPGVVSTFRDKDGKPQIITDPEQIYSGCILKAQLYIHVFQTPKPGITLFLNNAQKVRDGDRLDGKRSAQDVFEATDAPVDLSEMETAGVGAGDDSADLAGLL